VSWGDGLAAAITPDDKYVIMSPNMPYVPAPPWGQLIITAKIDGRFGMEDPIHWPQIYCPDSRFHFLCCMPRITHPKRQLTIWRLPAPTDLCLFSPDSLQALFTLIPDRLKKTRVAVDGLLEDVKVNDEKYASLPQLCWLALSTNHACQELFFPATQRDISQQIVHVELLYCMSLALLTWGQLTSNPSALGHLPEVDRNLMGCFITNPTVVSQLWQFGIPVWNVCLVDSLGPHICVVAHEPLSYPVALGMEQDGAQQLYVGIPGKRHLEAVCYRNMIRAGIEATPMPADYAPINSAFVPVTPAGPRQTSKSASQRAQPCRFIPP
jgi:hypothetical protein